MTAMSERLQERLRRARKLRNVNQKALADALGVNVATVSEWENGHSDPSFSTVGRAADHLRVSLDYLAGRVDEPGGRFGEGEAATTLARIEAVMDDVRGRVVVPEDDSAREADDFGPATDARKRRDECA